MLLLSPAIVGVLFALAKLWDGVNGPLIGSLSDRSRSRFGRRRPFLFASLPFLVVGFVMLWTIPRALEGNALIAWIGVALFIFYTAFDLYTLPHAALGAELSRDPHQRTRLFAVRQMSFTVGMLLAFGAIQVAMNAEDPRSMAAAARDSRGARRRARPRDPAARVARAAGGGNARRSRPAAGAARRRVHAAGAAAALRLLRRERGRRRGGHDGALHRASTCSSVPTSSACCRRRT